MKILFKVLINFGFVVKKDCDNESVVIFESNDLMVDLIMIICDSYNDFCIMVDCYYVGKLFNIIKCVCDVVELFIGVKFNFDEVKIFVLKFC